MSVRREAGVELVSIPRRKVEHDLKVSQLLLLTGIGLTLLWLVSLASGLLSQSGSALGWDLFVSQALPGIGGTLILVGAIFSSINWWMLRKWRRESLAR
jgi:hypothetical protein